MHNPKNCKHTNTVTQASAHGVMNGTAIIGWQIKANVTCQGCGLPGREHPHI
jgi:hypothetical protein